MKSKTPLALIEQTIMILVFALSAALCIGAFVHADSVSRKTEALSLAVFEAQSAAEAIKSGDESFLLPLSYITESGFTLTAVYKDSGHENLLCAEVNVSDERGNIIFTLPVSWQREEGAL